MRALGIHRISMTFITKYLSNYCECGGSKERYFYDGPSPSTYLEFSRKDLQDDNLTRSWVNSVGNSKRALHLQVEIICKIFGWGELYTKKIVGFPERLKFLEKSGVISPRILAKINKNRNKIEHDYYFPSKDEAEDYADIVELFISATNKFIENFPTEISFELMEDEEYDKSLSLPKSIEIKTTIETGGIDIISAAKVLKHISINDNDYFKWLSAAMYQYQL
jgi:hypothetical protein